MAKQAGVDLFTTQKIDLQNYLDVKDRNNKEVWGNFELVQHIPNLISQDLFSNQFGVIKQANEANQYIDFDTFHSFTDAEFSRAMLTNLEGLELNKIHWYLPFKQYMYAYEVNTMTKFTFKDWYKNLSNRESNIVQNYKIHSNNKTLYTLYMTCLATGNYKVIPGINDVKLDPTDADLKVTNKAFRALRILMSAHQQKQTSIYKGIDKSTLNIVMNPYATILALDAMRGTYLGDEAFRANQNGELKKWYGINIIENQYVGTSKLINDKAINVDNTKFVLNKTSESFDFSNLSAMIYTNNSVYQYTQAPFAADSMMMNNGFTFTGHTNKAARIVYFTGDSIVIPTMEAKNIAILEKAPTKEEINKARKYLYDMYPTVYKGIKEDLQDADVTKWNKAAGDMKAYSPLSNPYGFADLNTSGIDFSPKP